MWERGSALCCACERSASDTRMFGVIMQMFRMPFGSQPDLHVRSQRPLQWTALHFAVDGAAHSQEACG